MVKKIRFGVLGVAKIATAKVIPAMQLGTFCEVAGIASRTLKKAKDAAKELGIPKAYGSYEEMLADPDIDAVYNPLPNHMHVEWTAKAALAGKHVLCEKPMGMSAEEVRTLIEVREKTGVQMAEAFMVRVHPQWLRAIEIARSGEIGQLRLVTGAFSYNNRKPENIRNKPEFGGGALMDIGCYPINTSRWVFGAEPTRVASTIERDPEFGTDRLTSAMMEFPGGAQASFTVGTQLVPYQKMHLMGTTGRVEIEIPFNAPPDAETKIQICAGDESRVEKFPACDQYTLQGDAFAKAILGEGVVAVPIENSIANMAVIDAILRAATTGEWEQV